MQSETLFWIIIAILVFQFLLDQVTNALNASWFDKKIPQLLADVYDDDEYKKSQAYKKANFKFGLFTSIFHFILLMVFLFLDGFAFVDEFARSYASDEISIALIFFGVLFFANDIISIPFAWYSTFVIEEKFGFNKTTVQTFLLDKLKSWLMTIVLGGGILALLVWFYQSTGSYFWLYAWGFIAVFSIFMNMFYAKLIVPIFNKQSPLEEGELRTKIEAYANKMGFQLDNIFVIDGSKRSTKANAYFSGFGSEKRITLYDTLINDLEDEEIVAVLAHEVGHYKLNHIIINMVVSIITTGFTLWLLSLFIAHPLLSEALGANQPSFHIGLVAFGILYGPISMVTGLLMNQVSRKFEYQADNFAKATYQADKLVSSLKKLTQKSLSNLTPHPFYVWLHYSHPSLEERLKNLKNKN
ncbi:MAG: M48 family metallopeptidase [Bacteroidota bacterium]